MIDAYEIVKKIEDIYENKNSSDRADKKFKFNEFLYLIIPKIVNIFFYILFLYTIIFCDKCPLIQLIFLYCFVVSLPISYFLNQKYLKISHKIKEKNGNIFYYKIFKNNLSNILNKKDDENIQNINQVILAKNILEIEEQGDKRYNDKYFKGFIISAFLPILLKILEEYLKTNIMFSLNLIIIAFLFSLFLFLFDIFINRKKYIKKNILIMLKIFILEYEYNSTDK